MRGLNLSRLARTSEASFFKDTQASQAAEIRKALTPAELKEAQLAKSRKHGSVDVLPEILAHSASKNIVTSAQSLARPDARPLLARIATKHQLPAPAAPGSDPPVLRALGSGRLSVYANLKKDTAARPLPGSVDYADGAVLGMASFSIASAVVGTVGLAGGLFVYFNPSVIDRMQQETVQLRGWLDRRIGQPIRSRVHERWEAGPVLSPSAMNEAQSLARAAVGVQAPTPDSHDSAEVKSRDKDLRPPDPPRICSRHLHNSCAPLMGISATAVYDVKTHSTIILRTSSTAPADRQRVLDSIASFAQHCESLRGISRSALHVTALWGGPPYIAYELALARFRTIVIWDETPHDFDMAHDIHHAVQRLHATVEKVGDALLRGEPYAFVAVYNEAGYSLSPSGDLFPPDTNTKPSSHRSKLRSLSTSLHSPRHSEAHKDTNHPKGKLMSRLSSAFRAPSKSSRKDKEPRAPEAAPSKPNLSNSSTGLDDEVGPLALPEEFFEWCEFGPPLDQSSKADLAWLLDLALLDRPAHILASAQSTSRPILRGESVPSTPLTIPSSASPMSPARSGPSSVSVAGGEKANAGMSPHTEETQAELSKTTASTPAASLPASEVTPSLPGAEQIESGKSEMAVNAAPAVNPSVPQSIPVVVQQPAMNPVVPPVPSAYNQVQVAGSVGEGTGSQTMITPAPTPPQASSSSTATGQEFDVQGLGTIKDHTGEGSGSEEQAVRMRMNEFALTMQSGNFALALQQVVDTLRYLAQQSHRRVRETVTCANYVLALKILMRNGVVESELQRTISGTPDAMRRLVECALLTMFLAELKHILPRHRVAAMKVAVEKNLAVGNFGMAARWIRQLAEKAPAAQQQALAQKLQVCMMNSERNAHMPPTNRLCFSSLQVVGVPFGKCTVCEAVFHSTMSGVVEGQTCDVCFVGRVVIERRQKPGA